MRDREEIRRDIDLAEDDCAYPPDRYDARCRLPQHCRDLLAALEAAEARIDALEGVVRYECFTRTERPVMGQCWYECDRCGAIGGTIDNIEHDDGCEVGKALGS